MVSPAQTVGAPANLNVRRSGCLRVESAGTQYLKIVNLLLAVPIPPEFFFLGFFFVVDFQPPSAPEPECL